MTLKAATVPLPTKNKCHHRGNTMEFRRKPNRLRNYDYSSNGLYFVTICVENRSCRLGKVIHNDMIQGAHVQLSEEGRLVNDATCHLPDVFSDICIHNHIVMPNHVHIIIELKYADKTISHIVNYLKGYITRRVDEKLWQRSFYDHIIRSEDDFQKTWTYIDNNPGKWLEDRYYVP